MSSQHDDGFCSLCGSWSECSHTQSVNDAWKSLLKLGLVVCIGFNEQGQPKYVSTEYAKEQGIEEVKIESMSDPNSTKKLKQKATEAAKRMVHERGSPHWHDLRDIYLVGAAEGFRKGIESAARFLRRHGKAVFVRSEAGNFVEVSFDGHPAKSLEALVLQGFHMTQKHGGIKIEVDPSLKPNQWRLLDSVSGKVLFDSELETEAENLDDIDQIILQKARKLGWP